jgi:endonuclease/exonuclease/phosphatase family metal-dependent hydrolase
MIMPPRFIFTLLLLLSTVSINAQSLSDLSFGTNNTFEIMTWNIEEFPKNGATTVNHVKAVLEALQVDVICFQEIEDSTELKRIADNLEGYELIVDGGFRSGLAVMYKSDKIIIEDVYNIYAAPTYWNTFPRSPQVVEMMVDGEAIVVINNHLKCCGDGIIELGDLDDEETRRLEANNLLQEFIDGSFPDTKVILIGDLNDMLTDAAPNNVFQGFLNDSTNYAFADLPIENGNSDDWSYPLWTSHLDHILVTNEWFAHLAAPTTVVQTIKIDDFLPGGLGEYDANISDHRPVALKLELSGTLTSATNTILPATTFSIYPNPAVDKVQMLVVGNTPSIDFNFAVFDIKGNLMAQFPVGNQERFELDVHQFPRGMYFLKASNGAIQKLILMD